MKDGKDRVALVTGSTGYIGGQLIIELLKNGWTVRLSRVIELRPSINPGENTLYPRVLPPEAAR